jgi:hypothetical protein
LLPKFFILSLLPLKKAAASMPRDEKRCSQLFPTPRSSFLPADLKNLQANLFDNSFCIGSHCDPLTSFFASIAKDISAKCFILS